MFPSLAHDWQMEISSRVYISSLLWHGVFQTIYITSWRKGCIIRMQNYTKRASLYDKICNVFFSGCCYRNFSNLHCKLFLILMLIFNLAPHWIVHNKTLSDVNITKFLPQFLHYAHYLVGNKLWAIYSSYILYYL